MRNKEVARLFYQIADMEDMKDQPFKARAYRRAARALESMEQDVAELASQGKLQKIPGIGKALEKKIIQYVKEGRIDRFEKLRMEFPKGLIDVMEVPEIGPKSAKVLYEQLGVDSIEKLKEAAEKNLIRNLKGFGEKSEEKILQGIKMKEATGGRMLLGFALPRAERVVDSLMSRCSIRRIEVAGSVRRRKETIGDIDILAISDEPGQIMDAFATLPEVSNVVLKGPTKTTVILEGNIQADLRVVEPASFGAALQYFTGSKDHNIHLRKIAKSRGMKINEYGLFKGEERIGGETEEEIYEALGMPFIEPELREDRGEIEAAQIGSLPKLLNLSGVQGDLHVHSVWSDGEDSLETISERGREMKYSYIAIADHSKSLRVGYGLSEEKLLKQIRAIAKVNEELGDFRLLSGSEVDIKADGTLDYADEILRELDVVVAGVHSRFNMEEKEMTDRILTALSNDHVNILAHPTGRLIGRRDPYAVDIEKVIEAAASNHVAMEINCFPERLDLKDSHARMAKDGGVKISLGTDAHSVEHLEYIRYGVGTARRAWLEPSDVVNSMSLDKLKKYWGID